MELWRALGTLIESPSTEHQRIAELIGLPSAPTRESYTALFVLQLPPYASMYTSNDGMLGGVARDRVAGFWRALGFVPPAEPDHLAALFGLYAALADAEREAASEDLRARLRHARRALFWEHLACWLVAYLPRVQAVADPVYSAWSALALSALAAEALALDAPETLPLALHDAAPLGELDELSAGELSAALLTAARSGMLITPADLRLAAHDAGIGVRVGDRRFVLRNLLVQAPASVLAWLRARAATEAEQHARAPRALRSVASFWTDRARSCARSLAALELTSTGARNGS